MPFIGFETLRISGQNWQESVFQLHQWIAIPLKCKELEVVQ